MNSHLENSLERIGVDVQDPDANNIRLRITSCLASLDPVIKTNWEGTGVEPDAKVSAEDALSTAERLANGKIQAKATNK